MSADNNNHAPVPVEDFQDRLMDSALAELVGGRTPPDLSTRIFEAHDATLSTNPLSTSTMGGRWNRIKWMSVAIAATLLVGAITWLSFAPNGRQFAAKKNAIDEISNHVEPQVATLSTDGSSQGRGGRVSFHDSELAGNAAAKPESTSLSLDVSGRAGPEGDSGAAAIPGFTRVQPAPPWDVDAPAQQVPAEGAVTESLQQSKLQSGGSAARKEMLHAGWPVTRQFGMSPQPTTPQPVTSDEVGLELLTAQTHAVNESYDYYAITDLRALRQQSPDRLREPVLVSGKPAEVPLRPEFESRVDLISGDKYTPINENAFIKAIGPEAVSTFSIDVDTASYANVRQFLMETHQLPPANAVRIEELVNYFQYDYTPPKNDDEAPFAAHVEVAGCPWNSEHRLARIAVKGREMERTKRPLSNLVFLVDVSGSMNEPAKLPLVVYGLEQLTKELGENDHIAIVVYAGTEGLALPSTSGSKQDMILATLGKLQAGGSTAGGAGINLAYQIAEDNFIRGGTNRVILCTDGDFNVGVTDTGELQKLVEKKAKDTGVFLSVLGFGRGNLNDAMMEAISNHGNGNYHYVDNRTEARRVLVEEMTGTLVTIAKDVKIQVEFNPTQVAAYRLIGYEDRMLRTEDFNDDKKDAGEIGAGHNVTALYEVVPAGKTIDSPKVDELKYQKPAAKDSVKVTAADKDEAPSSPMSKELLTLKMRYKAPDGDTSKKLEWSITDAGKSYGEATDDFQFASAVAGFGLLLRDSQYKGNLTFAAVLELAQSGLGTDERGYRKEFLELVTEAKKLKHE